MKRDGNLIVPGNPRVQSLQKRIWVFHGAAHLQCDDEYLFTLYLPFVSPSSYDFRKRFPILLQIAVLFSCNATLYVQLKTTACFALFAAHTYTSKSVCVHRPARYLRTHRTPTGNEYTLTCTFWQVTRVAYITLVYFPVAGAAFAVGHLRHILFPSPHLYPLCHPYENHSLLVFLDKLMPFGSTLLKFVHKYVCPCWFS